MASASALLLLAASVLALLRPRTAMAQETEPARRGFGIGDSSRPAAQDQTAEHSRLSGQSAPATRPPQDNAPTPHLAAGKCRRRAGRNTTPTTAAGSIFDRAGGRTDDALADNPAPVPPRRPTTAKQSADEAQAKEKAGADKTKTAAMAGKIETAGRPATKPAPPRRTRTAPTAVPSPSISPTARRSIPAPSAPGLSRGWTRSLEDNPFAAAGIKVGTFVVQADAGARPDRVVECRFQQRRQTGIAVGNDAALQRHLRLAREFGDDRRLWQSSARPSPARRFDDTRGGIEGELNVDLDKDCAPSPRSATRPCRNRPPRRSSSSAPLQQPMRQTIHGSLGVEKDVGKMRLALTGAVEHDIYGDAKLSMGGTLSQKDRDSTLYHGDLAHRLRDLSGHHALHAKSRSAAGPTICDSIQVASSAPRQGIGARAGVQLDLGEKLAGEFSAGWLSETFDDDRLRADFRPDRRRQPQMVA